MWLALFLESLQHEFPFNFFSGCFSLNKYVIKILSLAKLCTARDRIFCPTEHLIEGSILILT